MGTHLIDLRQTRKSPHDDLAGLTAYLAQLVSELFRFARVSYGAELTLHFGDVRPGPSPKIKQKPEWPVHSGTAWISLGAQVRLGSGHHHAGHSV